MQYDQPTSVEDLVDDLDNNPRTQQVLQAIESVLNTDSVESVNVGAWDGVGEVTTPGGEQPDVLVIQPGSGSSGDINIEPNEAFENASVILFDSNANATFTIDADAPEIERVVVLGDGDDNVTIDVDSNTTINAADGNDTIATAGGDDQVNLGEGNSTVSTGAGDDTVFSGFGADTVDGGEGYDMVQLEGNLEDFEVTIEDGQIVLTSTSQPGNALTATGVEYIQLDDGESIAIGATVEEAEVLRLYQALLGRSTDREGAQYWIENDLDGNQMSVSEIANAILHTEEGSAVNELDDNAFISSLYENALGREASTEELAYWTGDLADGASRGDVAASIVASMEAEDSIVNVYFLDGNV